LIHDSSFKFLVGGDGPGAAAGARGQVLRNPFGGGSRST
jgi:hypothetical protein